MEYGFTVEFNFLLGFTVFIVGMLVLDLLVFHKRAQVGTMKESLSWSVFWVGVALVCNAILYRWFGKKAALEFLTGYLIELSLSVDNLFVFLMIFQYFRVPAPYQHRVLFWGIIGAIVMRGVMIFVGAALVAKFHWILYLFGVLLLYAAFKMAFLKGQHVDPGHNPMLKILRKRLRITPDYEGSRFLVRKEGVLWATPLIPVIVVIETSDLVFAVDSIPAIFAITTDFIVIFTSNMLAIMGLRTFYFLLSGLMSRFVYLSKGLAIILAFVGVKILVAHWWAIPTALSLGVVASIMVVSVIASVAASDRNRPAGPTPAP